MALDEGNRYDKVLGEKVANKAKGLVLKYFSNKKLNFENESTSTTRSNELQNNFNLKNMDKLEFFSNFDAEIQSPPVKSPEMEDTEFLAESNELAVPLTKLDPKLEHSTTFLVLATLNIALVLDFPFIMMRYGGWIFLVPFTVCTIFLTIPISLYQHFLGQFTSLPPILIFFRMAPILGGIGAWLTYLQILTAMTYKYDHKFASIIVEFVYELMVDKRKPFKKISRFGFFENTVPSICPEGTYFVQGLCIDTLSPSFYSFEMYAKKLMIEMVQKESALVEAIQRDIEPERIFDPLYENAHINTAIFITASIGFIAAVHGINNFALKFRYIVAFLITGYCTAIFCLVTLKYRTESYQFFDVVGFDTSHLFKFKTWSVAAVMSFLMFSVTDGSMYSLGMVCTYRSNFIKNLFAEYVVSYFAMFIIMIPMGITAVIGVKMSAYELEQRDLSIADIRNHIYNDIDIFNHMFKFFHKSLQLNLSLLMFCFSVIFWQTFNMILNSETSICLMYRTFKGLVRYPEFIVRYISLSLYFALVISFHVIFVNPKFQNNYARDLIFAAPYIIFAQLFSALILTVNRFYPCVCSVLKKYRSKIMRYRYALVFYFQIILPIVLFGLTTFDHLSFNIVGVRSYVAQIIYFGLTLGFLMVTGNPWDAFKPTSKWGPHMIYDRMDHLQEERALTSCDNTKVGFFRLPE
ncbi:unnamed protein product [Caenorhabditis bovis]|uniref:Uncharacterized protein n=1 Tax=Caenorhabditis bovis TaxID=2654633 RepID=A0A8S1EQX4_9PELO|nr:unnamed protein product [Caenorhabditis bovis]